MKSERFKTKKRPTATAKWPYPNAIEKRRGNKSETGGAEFVSFFSFGGRIAVDDSNESLRIYLINNG